MNTELGNPSVKIQLKLLRSYKLAPAEELRINKGGTPDTLCLEASSEVGRA